ncbi:MAG: efflux RND transporter periplasmic adaptor subunit [Myxococcota bacterium]
MSDHDDQHRDDKPSEAEGAKEAEDASGVDEPAVDADAAEVAEDEAPGPLANSPVPLEAVNWGGLVLMLVFGLAAGALFFGGGGGDEQADGHQHAEGEGGEEGSTTWTCSMHPQIQQDEPGQCPICGMDLIPASSDDDSGETLEPDQIRLDERAKKLARIRTMEVERRSSEGAAKRLLGRIVPDETRVKTVTAWTSGRIDRLRVATTGERIRRGQVIADIYSPEIYAAHRELLSALDQLQRLSDAQSYAQTSAKSGVESIRRKLQLLGVTDAQLERMEKADSPWESVPISAQFGGTVLDRLVDEGNYVNAGSGIYRVADLSNLWVQLDAYESDLPALNEGQLVELEVASMPGVTFEGKISFIDPVVDPNTRTAQVRVEVKNPDGKLRPGMWTEATVMAEDAAPGGDEPSLVIPESAPLFSGRRSIVYVEVPDKQVPTYEAREVKLGAKVGHVFPVIAGLEEGEKVVIHGAFVLDADLQIRGGKSLMTRPDDSAMRAIDRAMQVPDSFRDQLAPIFLAYLEMQRGLASDDLDAAKAASKNMQGAIDAFDADGPPKAMRAWSNIEGQLSPRVTAFTEASDIAAARAIFEDITQQLKLLLQHFGNPLDEELKVAYCPMAFDNRGAEWLQTESEVDNVYFGEEMRRCGEFRGTMDQGTHLGRHDH